MSDKTKMVVLMVLVGAALIMGVYVFVIQPRSKRPSPAGNAETDSATMRKMRRLFG